MTFGLATLTLATGFSLRNPSCITQLRSKIERQSNDGADQRKKVTYKAAITGYFEIDVKDRDYFDVADVEDTLRDYFSKFEWGGGHISKLMALG